jgi:hypothetical protein
MKKATIVVALIVGIIIGLLLSFPLSDDSASYPECLRSGTMTVVTPTYDQLIQLEQLQLKQLKLLQGYYTTEEEFRENDRLWCIAGNLAIIKEAEDKFVGSGSGMLDTNQETLDKFKSLDVKAIVQYIMTKDLYLGGDRGAKITVVIDSNEVAIATYVRCLADGDIMDKIDNTDIGNLSSTLDCT